MKLTVPVTLAGYTRISYNTNDVQNIILCCYKENNRGHILAKKQQPITTSVQ